MSSLYPEHHYGGQIQRAALAAALLATPDVLVVDDPTSSLDTYTARTVWYALADYDSTGAAVVAVTHDVDHVLHTGTVESVVIMRDGRVAIEGPMKCVKSSDDPYIQGFFRSFGS